MQRHVLDVSIGIDKTMKMASSPSKKAAVDQEKLNEEFYLGLYLDLVRDIADIHADITNDASTQRDCDYIARRVASEGLSFLTVTLPAVGKALDKAMSTDAVFSCPFLKRKRCGVVPKLFGYLFEHVLNSDGTFNSSIEHVSDYVLSLRQLVYFLYKLQRPWTKEQEEKCLSAFMDADEELPSLEVGFQELDDFAVGALRHARNIITNVFWNFDAHDIVPKHGPGAVATGERNHEKHRFARLYTDLEREYPFTEYFVFSQAQVCDQLEAIQRLTTLKSGTAKVVLVPKDSRGPRIISCEPLEYQWIQQGLGAKFRRHAERHAYLPGVNFTDQSINRLAALSASVDRGNPDDNERMVTVDLKEASDRVSCVLVRDLFADVPRLLDALMASRSTHTQLPDGRTVHLKKFAPMGSNLCFPVEAVVFSALATGLIVERFLRGLWDLGKSPSPDGYDMILRIAAKGILVYGDDIIVKFKDYELLRQYFPKFGLKLNEDKCCTSGFFRESCGMDAYKGIPVTPLRMKKVWCHHRVDPVSIESHVALCNAMWARGYTRTAGSLSSSVDGLLVKNKRTPLPRLLTTDERANACKLPEINRERPPYTPDLGVWAFVRHVYCAYDWLEKGRQAHFWREPDSGPYDLRSGFESRYLRFNKKLHRTEIRSYQAGSVEIDVDPDDWSMVLRRFTTPSEHSAPGSFALTRRSRCQRVWTPLPSTMRVAL